MKWTFIIRQKMKLALLLGSIIVLIGVTNILERRNVERLNQSVSSIYFDRLIPATDIFYLRENLYQKKFLMELALDPDQPLSITDLPGHFRVYNDSIDNLISKFEKTYLVDREAHHLAAFKEMVRHYNDTEASILETLSSDSREEGRKIYEQRGKERFISTLHNLESLLKIQSSVGHDLMDRSRGLFSSSSLLLTLQITMAIIIGIMIQGLVLSARTMDTKSQHLNLN